MFTRALISFQRTMSLQSTQDILMVLSGSFLIGGSDDRKGGRKALERRRNFPHAAQVHEPSPAPQQRGSSRPDCGPWHWQSHTGSSHKGSEPWDHSTVLPGFMTGWAGDMVLHPTTQFPTQRSTSLSPLAPLSMSLAPSSIIFLLFSPLSLKTKLLPCSTELSSLPFESLPNFSHTHLYSCHVLLPPFTAEIFIKLFFKPAGSFTFPVRFPSTAPYITKSSVPPCAE